MPFGFDDAAALVGLVTVFQACVQGVVVISKARCYGRDVSGIHLIFELELQKLYEWAEQVGILQEPQVLQLDTRYVPHVERILQHLYELVTDAEKLKRHYGLCLPRTADQLITLSGDEPTALDRLGIANGSDGKICLSKRIFANGRKPWQVLKWIIIDEQKVRKLLSEIGHFTKELQGYLERTKQDQMMKKIDVMYRVAVSNTASEQDLDMIGLAGMTLDDCAEGHIAAAARLKKRGLLLGIMEFASPTPLSNSSARRDSKNDGPERKNSYPVLMPRYSEDELSDMRLSAGRITLSDASDAVTECRMLAYYDHDPVLLEFRNIASADDHDVTKDRVRKVAAFLRDLDPSFHGLRCTGYVKIHERYAFVFDLKEDFPALLPRDIVTRPCLSFRTLRDLLTELPCPSLNVRMSLAITIIEAVLQLHTSGWLHKEFRSANTLFILPKSASSIRAHDFMNVPARIMGYAHARADDLYEMTEPLKSELEADLYRHPACLRQPREQYRRSFDMFSVGCLLLEIGCWRSLTSLLRECSSSNHHRGSSSSAMESSSLDLLKVRHDSLLSAKQKIPQSQRSSLAPVLCSTNQDAAGRDILCRLEASAGHAYTAVVRSLLYASDEEGRQELLHTETECLGKLKAIAAVI